MRDMQWFLSNVDYTVMHHFPTTACRMWEWCSHCVEHQSATDTVYVGGALVSQTWQQLLCQMHGNVEKIVHVDDLR